MVDELLCCHRVRTGKAEATVVAAPEVYPAIGAVGAGRSHRAEEAVPCAVERDR
jgi:hypothetical protein